MPIYGCTDTGGPQWAGTIRAGRMVSLGGGKERPDNSPHFLLHDAPGLSSVLGDTPKEIFFTVRSDNIESVAPSELAYYTKSELVCRGDGRSAAFFSTGNPSGVSSEQVPGVRARKRVCAYTSCPDYVSGNCTEHVTLNMVIPEFSMTAVFKFPSVSIRALKSIRGTLANVRVGIPDNKLCGEIFVLYKAKEEVKFFDQKSAKTSSRETDVVGIRHIPWAVVEREHKAWLSKLSPETFAVLSAWRNMKYGRIDEIAGAQVVPQIEATGSTAAQLPPPSRQSLPDPESEEKVLLQRANDPVVMPWFDKIAALTGKQNSEAIRLSTVRAATSRGVVDSAGLIDYLKGAIKTAEKKATNVTPPPQQAVTEVAASTDNLL